ncbi:MAG: hypothetical protein IJR70_06450 [Eubacterium sp.]|nr:hypothetical protein [Eubacterium sp.]
MMKVLSAAGKVTEKDSKTNIDHKFNVSKSAKRLVVEFSYSPKNVENESNSLELIEKGLKKYKTESENPSDFLPIRNLLTLSFDENKKYRGACHRHPNEQKITISNENSTPGIINKEIESGEWNAVLNVHFAGCEVEYSIEIEEEQI